MIPLIESLFIIILNSAGVYVFIVRKKPIIFDGRKEVAIILKKSFLNRAKEIN